MIEKNNEMEAKLDNVSKEIRHFWDIAKIEISNLLASFNINQFRRAIDLIFECKTRGKMVHIMGIGKPNYVAQYAAAIFSSTGTPATFLSASEVPHGSAGQVRNGDVVIAISNSGQTRELLTAVDIIKKRGVHIIGISKNSTAQLAKKSDVFISAKVKNEGDILNLPPRTSVVAEILAVASLSVGLQTKNGLTLKEYRELHNSGSIGKSLGV